MKQNNYAYFSQSFDIKIVHVDINTILWSENCYCNSLQKVDIVKST